jgi:hypothetical protein
MCSRIGLDFKEQRPLASGLARSVNFLGWIQTGLPSGRISGLLLHILGGSTHRGV